MLPSVVSGSIFRWISTGSFGIINFVLQGLGLLQGQRFWLTEPNYALLGTIIANIWVGIPFDLVLLLPGLQDIYADALHYRCYRRRHQPAELSPRHAA